MNVREWALPVYTILMQMAVGALLILWVIRARTSSKSQEGELNRMIQNPILIINLTSLLAMIGAHFHLSKPLLSFLAVLNLETSWLSREILFSVLFLLSTGSIWYVSRTRKLHWELVTGLGWLAIFHGLVLVYCMAFIYVLPTQTAWNSLSVISMFFVTTLLLGGVMVACLLVLNMEFARIQKSADFNLRVTIIQDSFKGLSYLILALATIDLILTGLQIFHLQQGDATAKSSLALLLELYLPLLIGKCLALIYGAFSMSFYVNRMCRQKGSPSGIMSSVILSSLLIIIAEVTGRFLFYAVHVRIGI